MARLSACLLAVSLLLAPALGAVCPEGCVCTTTPDGLHRATCSSIGDLYKFTLRQKHHNINILDLSHNNITKLNHELDRLVEVVTLDLSTNGITHLNKFLHNAKKLVHVNLANNRIQKLSLVNLPTSVSSLDLTNNLLKDVPSNLKHLANLEHLELDKNPLDCSCDNILVRDYLLAANVFIDAVKCASPVKYLGRSWLELKTKDVCKVSKSEVNELDMMMGDQPYNALGVGEDIDALRPESQTNLGSVIEPESHSDDDDSQQFLKVGQHTSASPLSEIEGSGDVESTTISEFIPMKQSQTLGTGITENEALTTDNVYSTDDPDEGSGEGSGMLAWGSFTSEEPTTVVYEQLSPEPVHKLIEDDNETVEFETPKTPSIYKGGSDWYNRNDPSVVTENPISSAHPPRDTTVSEKIQVTQASGVLGPSSEEPAPHKTGTYVCIAIIVVLLVGLIGFAIIKGQMRKRRDRRLLRQQKRDVEKASKEMVDMNKSLLGKPAVAGAPTEKKANGKYELVPTHEPHQKNGDVGNGAVQGDKSGRTDSPRDTNQNKSSSRDNNLTVEEAGPQETSFESDFASPDSAKDNHSLSSEDIFVPLNDDDTPRLNGTADSVSQPLINGDQIKDSDFLSPREYIPVYSPDMGRVRIKLSETPKPKTPVLVTRSRSNAGDIIITPSVPENIRKSTT